MSDQELEFFGLTAGQHVISQTSMLLQADWPTDGPPHCHFLQ